MSDDLYRIICFDGGPTILNSLYCLKHLEEESLLREPHKSIVCQADMFAGTSSGGITALYLASRDWEAMRKKHGKAAGLYALEHCIELVEDIMQYVSDNAHLARASLGMGTLFDNTGIEQLLTKQQIYGQLTVGDITQRNFVVPSYSLLQDEDYPPMPVIYHACPDLRANAALKSDSHLPFPGLEWLDLSWLDPSVRLADIALRSGAFPILFPIRDGEVDGGVFTNNPVMLAIMYRDHTWHAVGTPEQERLNRLDSLKQMRVLSFGSRIVHFGNKQLQKSLGELPNNPWGSFNWLLDPRRPLALADVITSSNSVIAVAQAYYLLGRDRFARIASNTDRGIIDFYMDLIRGKARAFKEEARSISAQWIAGYSVHQSDGLTAQEARRWLRDSWFDQPANRKCRGAP